MRKKTLDIVATLLIVIFLLVFCGVLIMDGEKEIKNQEPKLSVFQEVQNVEEQGQEDEISLGGELRIFNQEGNIVCSQGSGAWEKIEYSNCLGSFVVNSGSIRIRQVPSLGGAIVGVIEEGSITNYYETTKDENFTWYKIDKDYDWWIADDGTWITPIK